MARELTGFRENWIHCDTNQIVGTVDSFEHKLDRTYLLFDPGNIVMEVVCDSSSLLGGLDRLYRVEKKRLIPHGRLFYVTSKKLRIIVETSVGPAELKTHYDCQRCDVAYDPSSHTALAHGPRSAGFFKSMIVGIAADIQQDLAYYGVHAGIAVIDNTGRGYVGGLNAGKTTASFNAVYHAMCESKESKIVTDDWGVFFEHEKGKYRALGIERHALIRKEMIDIFPKLNLKEKFEKKVVMTETQKKAYIHPDEIFGSGTLIIEGPVDILILLFKKRTRENVWKPDRDEAVNQIIDSSYHIPNIDENRLRARKEFWGKLYDNLPVISASTRNLEPHGTHQEMETAINKVLKL